MEQYLNLVWKNYTASLGRNYDDENLSGDQDDNTDAFASTELHYTIPFYIGVIVIVCLCLSALIASIRYCFHTLCASHHETEKLALVSPRSPCLTSAANTIQRQRHQLSNTLSRHPSDEKEKIPPKTFHEGFNDHRPDISIGPLIRQHSRSHFTPTHSLARQHHPVTGSDDVDHHHQHQIPSNQTPRSRAPVDFRKKVHGIYVLPVSPALSSSSSTTNTDDIIKNSSSTMPIRSLRHLASAMNVQSDSSCRGIKNDCFADSPQPKDRTLPRSHAGTLRRVHQPPTEPPPLPPAIAQIHFNDIRSSNISIQDKSSFQHQSITMGLDPDAIALRFTSQKIYGAIEDNQMKKAPPPPVPCRSQKPTMLPIGFEGLSAQSNDILGFRVMMEPSPQDDGSEHTWPHPPESMTTSEISVPPQPLPPSIPYDRLHHDHLIPTVLMRQNSTTNFFQHHRFGDHSMLTESET